MGAVYASCRHGDFMVGRGGCGRCVLEAAFNERMLPDEAPSHRCKRDRIRDNIAWFMAGAVAVLFVVGGPQMWTCFAAASLAAYVWGRSRKRAKRGPCSDG